MEKRAYKALLFFVFLPLLLLILLLLFVIEKNAEYVLKLHELCNFNSFSPNFVFDLNKPEASSKHRDSRDKSWADFASFFANSHC